MFTFETQHVRVDWWVRKVKCDPVQSVLTLNSLNEEKLTGKYDWYMNYTYAHFISHINVTKITAI